MFRVVQCSLTSDMTDKLAYRFVWSSSSNLIGTWKILADWSKLILKFQTLKS